MTSESSPPPPLSADGEASEDSSAQELAGEKPGGSTQDPAENTAPDLAATLSREEGGASSQETPPKETQESTWSPEAWGQAARATCLSALLGMALVVFTRLALGGEWVSELLGRNKIPMPDRMAFLFQMIGGALVSGVLPLLVSIFSKARPLPAATWERWAWFLSPLILLPAIPVISRFDLWQGKHKDLLPIVLFGALIAELLFSKASANVPALVNQSWRKWWDDDKIDPESRVQVFLKKHGMLLLVCALAVGYGAFMSFYAVRWHNKLGTAIFDLGINDNLIFGGLEGRFNESTVIFPDEPQKYVANHVKMGLYTFLPIYALYPKPETLLVIQAVSMGLGAIPLFLFARGRLPELWAAFISIAYLSYYPLHGANFYEMKLPPTAASIVLTCIWAIDAKRFLLGGIFFVWALIMREDMPIPLAVVGAVFLLSGRRPRAGLAMAAISTVWFVILRFRIMDDAGSWWFPNMYEDLWAAPERGFRGVIKTLVSNPTYTLKHIFVEKKFWYLMHMMVPLAFLPVRRWWGWAALVPGAILTLLVTDYDPPVTFSFQYVMHWAPYTFAMTAVVLSTIREEQDGIHRARGALAALCLASLALTANYGAFSRRDKALESGYHKITFSFTKKDRETLADVRRLVASIPPKASVAATERVGAHLSSRVKFYTLRRGYHGADYIVARKAELRLDRTKESVRKALASGEYGIFGRYGEFVVLKKGAKADGNDALMKEWQLRAPTRSRRERGEHPAPSDTSRPNDGKDTVDAEEEVGPLEDKDTEPAQEAEPTQDE
jgi:uncharacterized membrane protein